MDQTTQTESGSWFFHLPACLYGASQVALVVKNLPAMQDIAVRFLGREDPLENGWTIHSSIIGKEPTC